jgi:cysteine desulfurase
MEFGSPPVPRTVYLDNHATTALDPRVLEAMLPYLTEQYGNAASRGHRFGWMAEKAVEAARRGVADLAGASPREIIFTSGATESINLALKGAMEANGARGRHIVTVATEHKAVLDTCRRLERQGCRLTVLPVDGEGRVSPEEVARALAPDTVIATVMFANNEIGVLHPVAEIGRVCRERGVLLFCDAVQAFGKVAVHVERDAIDLMAVSAHKMYGPKGVGALYVRRRNPRVQLAAQIDGGGHESGLRSGTLNVPGIVGFGRACALCATDMDGEAARIASLRDRLLERLLESPGEVRVNGSMQNRLPNNLNVAFDDIDSEGLLTAVPEIALSTGSACASATVEPSHVLRALGLDRPRAHASVRFGLGRFTTAEEVEYAAGRIAAAVASLRKLPPAV